MDMVKATTISAWGKAAGTHLAIVGLSLFLSLLVIQRVGLMPGEAIDGMVCGFLIFHGLAALVGTVIRKVSLLSCILVFSIAFFPGGAVSVQLIHEAIYLKFHAPYDRFRDHLASPVPDSVSNLHFVPLDEQIHPDLMLEFDIAPKDMDAILESLNLKQVDPAKMLNPKDFFQHLFYMPVEGVYHVFQGTDEFGEVLTIKTNELHSHAVFRMESSDFYHDRGWENGNPTIIRMDEEDLERLKRKYSK